MKHRTPSALSKQYLRFVDPHGFFDDTQRFIAAAQIMKDLFGFCDLMYMPGPQHTMGVGFYAIQTTRRSGSNVRQRIEKMRGLPAMRRWLELRGQVHVHGWSVKKLPVSKREIDCLWEGRWYLDSGATPVYIEPQEPTFFVADTNIAAYNLDDLMRLMCYGRVTHEVQNLDAASGRHRSGRHAVGLCHGTQATGRRAGSRA